MKIRFDNIRLFTESKKWITNSSRLTKYANLILASNFSAPSNASADVPGMQFNGMKPGRTYVAALTYFMRSELGGASVAFFHGGQTRCQGYLDTNTAASYVTGCSTVWSKPFVATEAIGKVIVVNLSSGNDILYGDGSPGRTNVTLYEVNNYVEDDSIL